MKLLCLSQPYVPQSYHFPMKYRLSSYFDERKLLVFHHFRQVYK